MLPTIIKAIEVDFITVIWLPYNYVDNFRYEGKNYILKKVLKTLK